LTEEKERRHIATFIHDQISQKLALAKMEFGAMSQSLSAAEQHKPAKRIRDLIDETIQDTRTLTFELSPPILYELGLEQSIGWLMEQFGEKHDIQFLFKDDGKPKPMDDDIRTILFQSVRELLTNTIKHSQAKEVKVSMYRERNKIQLTVEDDGIGFDPSKIKPYSVKTGGFGLFNIRERLEDFYGIMDIKSKKGQGTRVTLIAPLSLKKAPEIRK
jgi:signal transduction histidine kinase